MRTDSNDIASLVLCLFFARRFQIKLNHNETTIMHDTLLGSIEAVTLRLRQCQDGEHVLRTARSHRKTSGCLHSGKQRFRYSRHDFFHSSSNTDTVASPIGKRSANGRWLLSLTPPRRQNRPQQGFEDDRKATCNFNRLAPAWRYRLVTWRALLTRQSMHNKKEP